MTDLNIIYLHGFASGPSSVKAKFFEERANEVDLDIHIPDLNFPDFESMTLSKQIAFLDDLILSLRRNNAGKLLLVGSSMGGLLATMLSSRHESISGLVLMAPAFGIQNHACRIWGDDALRLWQENGYVELHHFAYGKTVRLNLGFWEDLETYTTEGLQVKIPTLVFHGKRDQTIPVRESLEFCQNNPQFTEMVLFDDDHQLNSSLCHIWQKTEVFFMKHLTDKS